MQLEQKQQIVESEKLQELKNEVDEEGGDEEEQEEEEEEEEEVFFLIFLID